MRGGCWLRLGREDYTPAPPDVGLIRMRVMAIVTRRRGARSAKSVLRVIEVDQKYQLVDGVVNGRTERSEGEDRRVTTGGLLRVSGCRIPGLGPAGLLGSRNPGAGLRAQDAPGLGFAGGLLPTQAGSLAG